MKRQRIGTLGIAAALLLAVGCAGGDEEAGADRLVGTYAATLPEPPQGLLKEGNPPGTWGLQVTSATEVYFQTPDGGSFPVGNPAETSDEQIVFTPDPECPTQDGAAGAGTYTWTLEEDELTFVEVNDTCRDRAFVLTTSPWTRDAEQE